MKKIILFMLITTPVFAMTKVDDENVQDVRTEVTSVQSIIDKRDQCQRIADQHEQCVIEQNKILKDASDLGVRKAQDAVNK